MLLIQIVEEFGIREPLAVVDDFPGLSLAVCLKFRLGRSRAAYSLLHYLRNLIGIFFILYHGTAHSPARTAASDKKAQDEPYQKGHQKCNKSFALSIHH